MTNATGGTMGRDNPLQADFEALKNDFAALRADLGVLAQDAGSAARSGAASAAGRLRDTGREEFDSAKAKARQAKDQAQGQIEDHPFMAVGIAFGVGVLIGAIVARR